MGALRIARGRVRRPRRGQHALGLRRRSRRSARGHESG